MKISWELVLQFALATIAGLAVSYQAGMNAKFAAASPSRIHGGVLSFTVGTLALVMVMLAMRAPVPQPQKLAELPWWAWCGGLLGAFFVMIAIFLAPRMGMAMYVACMLAGQLIGSVIIDHFGHMGFTPHPFTPGRAIGIVLLIAGVACIKFL